MSPRDELDILAEATVTAHRRRDADGLPVAPPEWWDLPPEAREQAFERQLAARLVERALDARGWSSTAKAVMERL